MMRKTTILTLTLSLLSSVQLWAKDYRVSDFGAVADGTTLNTRALQRAIDVIHEEGGGKLIFPLGRYVSGTLHLLSGVTLHLESGAVLLGSNNPYDYDREPGLNTAFLLARGQKNIGVTGEGLIDCRGRQTAYNLVDLIHRGLVDDRLGLDRPNESIRPMIFYFRECDGVTVEGISLKNSASWVQTYDQCKNLKIDRINVESNAYWNNDGLDIVDCENVTVTNSYFDASDDAICLKSHSGAHMCRNILIRDNVARSGASGIKFGTVSAGGFKDIRIINNKVYDTYRSAITIQAVDGAKIDNIFVDSLYAIHTGNVIYLRIGDRWSSGRQPSMSNITIQNVYAEVPAGKPDKGYDYEGPQHHMPRNISPCGIVGLSDHDITNVTLRNIKIIYPGGGNPFFAYRGLTPAELDSIPEARKSYPEFSQFRELPAWGFYIRHAKNITMDNVQLIAQKPDYRPAIVLDDVHGIKFDNVTYTEPGAEKKQQLFPYQSTEVTVNQ